MSLIQLNMIIILVFALVATPLCVKRPVATPDGDVGEPPRPTVEECPECPTDSGVPNATGTPEHKTTLLRHPQLCKKINGPPAPPEVNWAPPECPLDKFGACLTGEDLLKIIQYRKSIDLWQQDAYLCAVGQ